MGYHLGLTMINWCKFLSRKEKDIKENVCLRRDMNAGNCFGCTNMKTTIRCF
ncbi:hypothetical protein ANME2D_03353 [Candidatus Methanoperedens nitroreducens]|uniref:Uncharacterized protein n=1 Tax=Candidatus Methanoperedens nitratireducens TaxID=1392998 RepID=A0A062V1F8_9EURY|nr:hypothetical protein ANME2D_03353 [Candidatus Methanoperedens nitroreducens]